MIEISTILILSFINRVRGGLFENPIRKVLPIYNTTIGRLLISSVVGLLSIMLGGSYALGLALIPAVFIGHAIGPFAPWQFMGSQGDLVTMGIRGVILTGAMSVAIASLHSATGGLIMLFGGFLMGPTYYLAQQLPLMPFLNDNKQTEDKNDTAEVLFGAVLGILLVLSMAL